MLVRGELAFPDIDPVAFSIGPFEARWYALAYVAGLILAFWYMKRLVSDLALRRIGLTVLVPLLVWLAVTRRWRAAFGALAGAVGSTLVAWAVIGFDGNRKPGFTDLQRGYQAVDQYPGQP